MSIKDMCSGFKKLNEDDIYQLESMSKMLDCFAELSKADIFIDCINDEGTQGIVIAHGKSKDADNLYKETVIGKPVLPENEPIVFSAYSKGITIRDLKGVTQESKAVMQRAVPIKNQKDRIIGVLIEERDYSKSLRNNEKIKQMKETTERFAQPASLFENYHDPITDDVSDGIIIFDKDLIAVYANPTANMIYSRLGHEESLIGNNLEALGFGKDINEYFPPTGEKETEIVINDVSLLIKGKIVQIKGQEGFAMIIHDVSGMKAKEKELILKTVAVQEMHHRIKNNLQTIASVLRLQARRCGSAETEKAIMETISRINSIAAIHELTENTVDETVSLKEILFKIASNTKNYVRNDCQDIEIDIIGEDMRIEADKGVQIAIVINELVSNAVIHGFHSIDKGKIIITINKGMLYSTISVEDNGIGFDTTDINKKQGLGLELVKITVKEKLKGDIKISSNKMYSCISFDFK